MFAMGDPTAPWCRIQINIIPMGVKQAPVLSKGCIRKLTQEVLKTDLKTARQMEEMIYFDNISLGLTYEEARQPIPKEGMVKY